MTPLRQKVTHRRGTSTRAPKATASPHFHTSRNAGIVTFPPTGAPDVGDVGDLISECACERHYGNGHIQIIAFRADRDGAIHIMERKGVLIGYPGELGTVGLTAEDTKTLGLSDLKKELAARGHDWVFPPTERGYREFLIHKLY